MYMNILQIKNYTPIGYLNMLTEMIKIITVKQILFKIKFLTEPNRISSL